MSSLRMLVAACAILLSAGSVRADESGGFGVGAYPLSPTTVSMWLLRTAGEGKPLPVVLVYFTGAPGWHNRRWESKFEGKIKQAGRTTYQLVSSGVTLEISISDDTKAAWVQGEEFPLEAGNVFVVRNADRGARQAKPEALGSYRLPYSDAEPLALAALREHPELKASLNE